MVERNWNQRPWRPRGHITVDGGCLETTEREGLDNMDWTEGHSDCREGRDEKSKSVLERLRETAEKTGTVVAEVGIGLKGRERASATTYSEPGM